MTYFSKPAPARAQYKHNNNVVGKWIFYVDDGQGDLVESSEFQTGDDPTMIRVRRIDPLQSGANPAPHNLLSIRTLEAAGLPLHFVKAGGLKTGVYDDISDHWHVYAHGYHWIAFSLLEEGEGVGVGLVQFTMSDTGPTIVHLDVVFGPPRFSDIAGASVLTTPPEVWWPSNTGSGAWRLVHPTNDLFLTPTTDGVAIGILHQPRNPANPPNPSVAKGHTILEIAWTGFSWLPWLPRLRTFYDSATTDYSHDNGASAYLFQDYRSIAALRYGPYFEALVPDFITINNESALSVVQADTDWNLLGKQEIRREAGMNLSMATAAMIPAPAAVPVAGAPRTKNQVTAAAYKRVDTSTVQQGNNVSDSGELFLWLYWLSDIGTTTLHHEQIAEVGNRPHVTFWRDHLIVGWDGASGNASVYEVVL